MKHILKVLTCFLILLIAPAQASEYRSSFTVIPAVNRSPIRVATWKTTPIVIVCEYAPISEVQINNAVTFWKKLGHRFYRTQYKHDPLDKCDQKTPVGYIMVRLVTQNIRLDPDSLAITHFYVDNSTKKIEWANVYIMESNLRETVLEHEIGHALGFLHYNKINHLMNSIWTQGGWDTEGLRKTHQ